MKLTKSKTLVAAAISLGLAACAPKTAEEFVNDATGYVQSGDLKTAEIELKSGIQAFPDDQQLRVQLASVYLAMGNAQSAKKELEVAYNNQFSPDTVMPLLAEAMLIERDYELLVSDSFDTSNLSPEAKTQAITYQGVAFVRLGEPGRAKVRYDEAVALNASNVGFAELAKASFEANAEDFAAATETLNGFLAQFPDNPQGLLLNALMLSRLEKKAEALAAYERYQKRLPQEPFANMLLANAYVGNQQFAKAEPIVDGLLKISARQPLLNQLKAIIAFDKSDYENAKKFAEISIQAGLDAYSNRLVAGMSSISLDNYEQAYNHLITIEDELAPSDEGRNALTFAKIKLGYDILDNDVKFDGDADSDLLDFEIASMASMQLLGEGQKSQAADVFSQISGVELQSSDQLLKKGLVELAVNRNPVGIDNLRAALEKDPESEAARIALASFFLDSERFEEAKEVANEWIAYDKDSESALNLSAYVNLRAGDLAGAEKSYEMLLEKYPSSVSGLLFRARQAELINDNNKAQSIYTQLLDANPTSAIGLERFFMLQRRLGNTDEVTRRAMLAHREAPDDVGVKSLYSQMLLQSGGYPQVLKLWEGVDETAQPISYWVTYGDALAALGEVDKAEAHFKNWMKIAPDAMGPRLKLVMFYEAKKDYQQAARILATVQRDFPDSINQISVMQANLDIQAGNLDKAERLLSTLESSFQVLPVTQGLRGQIALKRGDAASAIPLLQTAFEGTSSRRTMGYLVSALTKADRADDAISLLRNVSASGSRELLPRVLLADLLMNRQDPEAVTIYEAILKIDPTHLIALNNTAWLYSQQGDLEKALENGQKAVERASTNPLVLDTFGGILLKAERYEKALEVMTEAFKRRNNDIGIALHYSEALIRNAKLDEAKVIIDVIAEQKPEVKDEIERLRAMM